LGGEMIDATAEAQRRRDIERRTRLDTGLDDVKMTIGFVW
jgi:hypothetical protein